MDNSIILSTQLPSSPVSIYQMSFAENNIVSQNVNIHITRNMDNVDINNAIDNLLISHFLVQYNTDSIYNIDPSIIDNILERSLLHMILQNENNIETQLICLETSEELSSQIECNICFEVYPIINNVGMNCRHNMCKSCMQKCLSIKKECPFCRQQIRILDVKDPELLDIFTRNY